MRHHHSKTIRSYELGIRKMLNDFSDRPLTWCFARSDRARWKLRHDCSKSRGSFAHDLEWIAITQRVKHRRNVRVRLWAQCASSLITEYRQLTTAAVAGNFFLLWSEHVHGKSEGALLRRLQRTYSYLLSRNFFSALISNREHHRVLPRFANLRMTDRTFDAQTRETGMHVFRHPLVEPQVVPADRADVGALENRRLAVRTTARRARRADTRGTHAAEPLSILMSERVGFDSQPNSA